MYYVKKRLRAGFVGDYNLFDNCQIIFTYG